MGYRDCCEIICKILVSLRRLWKAQSELPPPMFWRPSGTRGFLPAGTQRSRQGKAARSEPQTVCDSYTPERLEAACDKALFYTPRPSYKAVQAILKSGQDKPPESSPPAPASQHGFTRGADYYKGGRK